MLDKIWYTKDELITEWLSHYPNDKDWKHNSIAGYVKFENGLYMQYRNYELYRKGLIDENGKKSENRKTNKESSQREYDA